MEKLDQVVVGANLKALLFSFHHQIPFVGVPEPPSPFEFFEPNVDLSKFGLKNKKQLLKTNKGNVEVGIQKIGLWEKLFFFLIWRGLSLADFDVEQISIYDQVFRTISRSEFLHFETEKFFIFSDHKVFGLPDPIDETDPKLEMFDWFDVIGNVETKTYLPYDFLQLEDDFINQIWQYKEVPSPEKRRSKFASKSFILKSQIDDVAFVEFESLAKTLYFANHFMWKREKRALFKINLVKREFKQHTLPNREETNLFNFPEKNETKMIELEDNWISLYHWRRFFNEKKG